MSAEDLTIIAMATMVNVRLEPSSYDSYRRGHRRRGREILVLDPLYGQTRLPRNPDTSGIVWYTPGMLLVLIHWVRVFLNPSDTQGDRGETSNHTTNQLVLTFKLIRAKNKRVNHTIHYSVRSFARIHTTSGSGHQFKAAR